MDNIQATIRAFLAKYFPGVELTDDQDIFELGFINSLFAMQLVLFVEKEFHLSIEGDELDIDHFRSIGAITDLIQRKTAVPHS